MPRRSARRRWNRKLVFRAPWWAVVVLAGLVGGLVAATVLTGYAIAGSVSLGLVILAWLALAVRVTSRAPAGPWGGPASPGGAGVREPRRPRPNPPAGAAAMPLPDEGPTTAVL